MRALVTGGGGFLGGRIATMLNHRGDHVVALGRRRYPHIEAAGIPTMQADVGDGQALRQACAGIDVVFHVAAVARLWCDRRTIWSCNVEGTCNVIDACRHAGVRKLVYTSSPSVVFGRDDLCGVDESQPYPRRFLAHYPETKATAEKLVLAANGPELATIALRPHLIWGPGDPHLIPRVLERARAGRLVQVGDGSNQVDITYIDNAAEAHLLAADALAPGAVCAGRAYFISQVEPVSLWPWLGRIIRAAGAPPVTRRVTFSTAYRVGAAMETAWRVLRLRVEPPMTRFLATQLAKSHYFDISAARCDLGYQPRISTEEGLEALLRSLSTANPGITVVSG
jgi:nucleoside-diphosphate-sugar epimerase